MASSSSSSSSSSSRPSKPHFLLMPLPEHGHANPMLCLASHLAALGCTVTFVTAQKAPLASHMPSTKETTCDDQIQTPPAGHPSALQDSSYDDAGAEKRSLAARCHVHVASTNASIFQNAQITPHASNGTSMRFWTLPYVRGLAPLTEASSRFEILKHTLSSLEERQGMVEKLVQDSKSSDAPIACIICDVLLCSWVMNLAKQQAIPAAMLVPCSGASFYSSYMMKLGKLEEIVRLWHRFGLPEMKGPTNPEEMKRMAEVTSVLMKSFDHVEEASHVLVNSFRHLELPLLESPKVSELNLKFIGPCLPAWEAGDDVVGKVDQIMVKQSGCVFTPDHACLSWLDRQERGSVLFVSFGSEGSLEEEQVWELALGIEASGHKFLWVVRPDAPSHNLPQEDFRKRTSDIGMFVSWAPQRKVLQHEAVGGFLTHCGWNSTLESMTSGVPMLCFPLNGDQFVNAQLIHEHWKVGLRLGHPQTLVLRAEVKSAVRDLMNRKDLRDRIAQLKEAAHCSIIDSRVSIISFVNDIANKSHQKLED